MSALPQRPRPPKSHIYFREGLWRICSGDLALKYMPNVRQDFIKAWDWCAARNPGGPLSGTHAA